MEEKFSDCDGETCMKTVMQGGTKRCKGDEVTSSDDEVQVVDHNIFLEPMIAC